jgi:hypothetical protein
MKCLRHAVLVMTLFCRSDVHPRLLRVHVSHQMTAEHACVGMFDVLFPGSSQLIKGQGYVCSLSLSMNSNTSTWIPRAIHNKTQTLHTCKKKVEK